KEARPDSPYTSKARPLGMPKAVRDTENDAVGPDRKRAENTAVSSLSTSPSSSLTGTASWPTTAPSGSGRLPICTDSAAPDTDSTGPNRYSPMSMMCEPMSPRAPVPMPPVYRQPNGPRGSHAYSHQYRPWYSDRSPRSPLLTCS